MAVTHVTASPQAAVLTVLRVAHESLSRREIRDRINTDRVTPLVIERVYEALVAQHHRGMVARCSDGHHVHWRLASG